MTLGYTIDVKQRLVTIRGDYAEAEDWKALLSRILHDPQYEPGYGYLRDLRGANVPEEPLGVSATMQAVVGFWRFMQPARAAIVYSAESPPPNIVPALTDAEINGLPIRAFATYDAAIEWLLEAQREPQQDVDVERIGEGAQKGAQSRRHA